jgi:DNA repair protein RecO (recombination protein O)
MLTKTRGIVLKSFKYQDSSLICDVYTESFGLRSYIVSGVYSKKGKSKSAYFYPLSQLSLVVYEREEKSLNRIKELEPYKIHLRTPFEIVRGSVALFMTELFRMTLKEHTPNASLYLWMDRWIDQLDEVEETNLSHFPIYFLLQLCDELGLGMSECDGDIDCFDLREGVFTPHTPIHADHLSGPSATYLNKLLMHRFACDYTLPNRTIRNSLLQSILRYLQLHIDSFKPIQSLDVLSKVLH